MKAKKKIKNGPFQFEQLPYLLFKNGSAVAFLYDLK